MRTRCSRWSVRCALSRKGIEGKRRSVAARRKHNDWGEDMTETHWTRRDFIHAAGASGLAATLPALAATEPPPETR